MTSSYEDIIHLPHHVSQTRARMSLLSRAAQFAPFAALTGYDAAVAETARLTQQKRQLDVDAWTELNRKLLLLKEGIWDSPQVTVTYFVPDEKKAGGAYVTVTGRAVRLEEQKKWLMLADGRKIPFGDILTIEGDWLEGIP